MKRKKTAIEKCLDAVAHLYIEEQGRKELRALLRLAKEVRRG